ncbi:unnamed protein product [Clonostachys rosea]|uniref:Galactose oxidase n=1 Tax=Bionectria ochroleuca TaxID=29856 RepID=A0ABY6UYC6_BIOOC|nr:unnamed protein product [Clonostachys rosea]
MHFPSPLTFVLTGLTPVHGLCTPCKRGIWQDAAPIPIAPRQEHTTVALSPSTLAILGGIVPSDSFYSTTDMMQLYHIKNNSWTSAASIPLPLNHANAAVVDGKLYLLGGLAVAPDGAWRAVPDCWVYTPNNNRWSAISPMPNGTARGSAAVGVHEKTIYLAGGMTTLDIPGGGYQDSVDTLISFDTHSGKWKTHLRQNLPEGRDHAGSAVIGSTHYVLGGRYFGQQGKRDTVFSLDLRNPDATWQTSPARMPTPRGGVSTGVFGSEIYIFGGEGNTEAGSNGVFHETEVYNVASRTWAKMAPMRLPTHGTSAVTVGHRVYIPGGGIHQSANPVNNTEVLCI